MFRDFISFYDDFRFRSSGSDPRWRDLASWSEAGMGIRAFSARAATAGQFPKSSAMASLAAATTASSAKAVPTASTSASTSPAVTKLVNASIAADVAKYLQNGSLSYGSVLTILQDAASGGINASEFSTLQTFAGELNANGGIKVSTYVQQITDDVILGNSANATWNGGSSTATALRRELEPDPGR